MRVCLLGCGRSLLLCMTHFVCCTMCPHVCVCLGVNTLASLFLFSPCYHHDNLLTPAQPHTANISLPSPFDMFVFLTPSPHPLSPSLPPSLSHLSALYTPPSSLVSSVSISCSFPIPDFLHLPCYVYMLPSLERVLPSSLSSLQKVYLLFAQLYVFHFSSLCSAPC